MSSSGLSGRVALVTGASRGIGREIAVALAREGADVAVVARSSDKLAEVAVEIEGLGRRCAVISADVTEESSAERICAETTSAFGGITILVNNAGGNSFMAPLQTMRLSGWRKTFNLNLDSIVALTQAALPALIASGKGSIINVASVAGLRGSPLMSHYGAAKAALLSLTQSLSIELASQGVRVNSLVPGWIETDLTDFLRTEESTEQGLLSRVPMARWGRSEEIAQGALFLAGDASSFMTGQSLVMDGGLSAMP
jgi:NAD(P)-dependent dehydrogenase (short-subunit alcohol dehydrogenase family)